MIRRTGGDPLAGIAAVREQNLRARDQARFALAHASPEPRVPLEGFDVAVAELDGVFEFVQGHVLAAADQDLQP